MEIGLRNSAAAARPGNRDRGDWDSCGRHRFDDRRVFFRGRGDVRGVAGSRHGSAGRRLVAQQSEAETKGLVTPADFLEWSARARSFEVMAAWRGASFNVSAVGNPVRASAQLVTPGYLGVFGWQPVLGRGFTESDARPGAPNVIVASHAFWQNTLGSRPDVLGQSVLLDGEPAMVVGVLPHMPAIDGFFVPMTLADQRDDQSSRTLFVNARLNRGVGLDAARSEMAAIAAALERESPATHRGWTINVRPLQEEFVGPQARLVFALLSAWSSSS